MGGLSVGADMAGQLEDVAFERDDKDYYLHVVFEVPDSRLIGDGLVRPWHGKIEIPPVLVPLKRKKVDPAKLGPVIEKLGREMLGSCHDSAEQEAATRALRSSTTLA